MSIKNGEAKPYSKIIIVSILVITILSISIFVIFSQVQTAKIEYTKKAEKYSQALGFIETDIQNVLSDDGVKYDNAYSYLLDLYALNRLYQEMKDYNLLYPGNFTQQDLDTVAMEFTVNLRQLIAAVEETWIYQYCIIELGATLANNYTYLGEKWFLIEDKWNSTSEPIHSEIKNWVITSFTITSDVVQLPTIKFSKWQENLYGNLSILQFLGYADGVNYAIGLSNQNLNLVNVSLIELYRLANQYLELSEKASVALDNLNNTIITIATSALIIAFAISFNNKRNIFFILIIGLIVLALAFVYLGSTYDQFADLAYTESTFFPLPTN